MVDYCVKYEVLSFTDGKGDSVGIVERADLAGSIKQEFAVHRGVDLWVVADNRQALIATLEAALTVLRAGA